MHPFRLLGALSKKYTYPQVSLFISHSEGYTLPLDPHTAPLNRDLAQDVGHLSVGAEVFIHGPKWENSIPRLKSKNKFCGEVNLCRSIQ